MNLKNAAATGKAFGLGPCHPMISFILATRPQRSAIFFKYESVLDLKLYPFSPIPSPARLM
jgi:hypothetical protein